jgi:hypothetical protein
VFLTGKIRKTSKYISKDLKEANAENENTKEL